MEKMTYLYWRRFFGEDLYIIALCIADTSVFLEILVHFLNNLPKKTDSSGHQMNFGKIN